MAVEENKANIRRQVEEFWNKGDFTSVPELISEEFIYRIPGGELKGYDGLKNG